MYVSLRIELYDTIKWIWPKMENAALESWVGYEGGRHVVTVAWF